MRRYNNVHAYYGRAHKFKPTTLDLISSTSPDSLILDFGGGDRRLDLSNYVNFDVVKHPSMTNVVGDGHFLPFKDNIFAIIICEAVIEHCKKPWIVADELFRVLKKGGYIYVDAAFMQPLHGYPHHYFNTSKQGLEVLFERFKKVSSGVQSYQMPSYTVLYVLLAYFRCLFPAMDKVGKMGKGIEIFDERAFTKRRASLNVVLLALYRALHRLLTHLDQRISPERAERIAAGVYFLGQKNP